MSVRGTITFERVKLGESYLDEYEIKNLDGLTSISILRQHQPRERAVEAKLQVGDRLSLEEMETFRRSHERVFKVRVNK